MSLINFHHIYVHHLSSESKNETKEDDPTTKKNKETFRREMKKIYLRKELMSIIEDNQLDSNAHNRSDDDSDGDDSDDGSDNKSDNKSVIELKNIPDDVGDHDIELYEIYWYEPVYSILSKYI